VGLFLKQYVIRAGDSFFRLAQQFGCCCQDFVECNPGLNPNNLQIGQVINVPGNAKQSATGTCAEIVGKGCSGRCDDVLVEVEGIKFKVIRVGEASIPHEVHLILPRTEIRKVEYPERGVVETTIMLSNINIVNSPRFHGESSVKIETAANNNFKPGENDNIKY